LLPKDRSSESELRWGQVAFPFPLRHKIPEENPQLFRRDQSDLDGTFTFHSVIPGDYTVIAIDNGWDLDWSRAAVISPYIAHGQKLLVGGPQNFDPATESR
jgi:hypothetical protein